jgi:hypothetical protein
MSSRDQDYALIAVLHDQLEAVETYNKHLKGATDCEECAGLWTRLKTQAEENVSLLRAEIQRHAVD